MEIGDPTRDKALDASLFLKHADTLFTVLVAKDRVLAHAPAAALHAASSHYPWLAEPR